jgi:hypothetical protein
MTCAIPSAAQAARFSWMLALSFSQFQRAHPAVQFQHCFKSFCHDAVGTTTLTVTKKTMVASGFPHVPPAAAVVLAPTGLAFDEATDTRYVASTADNAIYAVAHAGNASGASGPDRVAFFDAHLRGPLALRWHRTDID